MVTPCYVIHFTVSAWCQYRQFLDASVSSKLRISYINSYFKKQSSSLPPPTRPRHNTPYRNLCQIPIFLRHLLLKSNLNNINPNCSFLQRIVEIRVQFFKVNYYQNISWRENKFNDYFYWYGITSYLQWEENLSSIPYLFLFCLMWWQLWYWPELVWILMTSATLN